MSDRRKQSSALLSMTEPDRPALEVDLPKLNRLYKWLVGFFLTGLGSLAILIFVPIDAALHPEGSTTVFIGMVVSAWGYLITLGRMAATLHRSVITWVGLTFILTIFGYIGSFVLMNSRVTDAGLKSLSPLRSLVRIDLRNTRWPIYRAGRRRSKVWRGATQVRPPRWPLVGRFHT